MINRRSRRSAHPSITDTNITTDANCRSRFARPADPNLVCRKVGEVGFTLYASPDYLASHGRPARGGGLRSYDLIGFTGAPAATSPFFMAESLEGARLALRCNSPFLQLKAAADRVGITEAACFLGDRFSELIRVWPDEPPHLRPVWLILHGASKPPSAPKMTDEGAVPTVSAHEKSGRSIGLGRAAKREKSLKSGPFKSG